MKKLTSIVITLTMAMLIANSAPLPVEKGAGPWTFFRASPQGRFAKEPRLIPTKHGLHLAWLDATTKHLHIAPFQPRVEKLDDYWPAKFKVGPKDVKAVFGNLKPEQFLDSYDVKVGGLIEGFDDILLPRQRASFLAVTRRFFLPLDGPVELLSVRVIPHAKEKQYEFAEFGKVITNTDLFYTPIENGGVGRDPPMYSCLLRRPTAGGTCLYLAVSDLNQIWTTDSIDGGKTWARHRPVRSDRYWCELVELPGEMLMFCATRDLELQLMRSQDGKKWSEPEAIFPKLRISVAPSAKPDRDGTIWLAFGVGEVKRSIVLTRSTDAGKTWSPREPVTSGLHDDRTVSFAFDNGAPVIVFQRVTNAGAKETSEIWAAVRKTGR